MSKTPMSIQFVLRTFCRAVQGEYGGFRGIVHRIHRYFWTKEELLSKAIVAFREAGNPAPCPMDCILNGKKEPKGPGVYLRLDYWNRILSGGSYGHTCYVANELNIINPGLICLMGQEFPLLNLMGLRQKKYRHPWGLVQDELSVIEANKYYYKRLKARIERLAPAYIYERIVLGSWVGARIAKELNIPYIAEFNGSELTMKRTFDDFGYENEAILSEIERFSLEQAALITVVSRPIMEDLVQQGMSKDRILVNPNGVDTSVYAPASQSLKDKIRMELGFSQSDKVIAFIGSFGGWHGIEILAEALLPICQADSAAKFLLIGDGNFRHLLTDAINTHDLKERVVLTGMVPQDVGARYLKAADIYVSPHSCHMDSGKFFGSPTKLFEYMAMGGGIVASDLEQIGQVLTPGLSPAQAWEGELIDQHRAVLCKPADVDDFVAGVSFLLHNPAAGRQMGKNARVAVQNYFSWKQHVARIWDYAGGNDSACFTSNDEKRKNQNISCYSKVNHG